MQTMKQPSVWYVIIFRAVSTIQASMAECQRRQRERGGVRMDRRRNPWEQKDDLTCIMGYYLPPPQLERE